MFRFEVNVPKGKELELIFGTDFENSDHGLVSFVASKNGYVIDKWGKKGAVKSD